MQKVLIGLSMLSNACFAQAPDSFSFSAGLSSMGPDVGYSLGVISPYIDERLAFSLQYGQYAFNAMRDQRYQDFQYGVITFSTLNRLYRMDQFSAYFRSGFFLAPQSDLTNRANIGLNFAIGTEFATARWLTAYVEVGWAFPILTRATNFQDKPFANGPAIQFGVKFYP